MKKKNLENTHKVVGIFTDWNRPNSDGSYGAIGWYRVVNPIDKLGGVSIGRFALRRDPANAMELKAMGDIWYSKLTDNQDIDYLIGAHKEFTGAKLIIDLDDDPVTTNKDHPEFAKLEEKKEMRLRMLKIADHVVCSTDEIAQVVRPINPYITVIPNAIDPAIWQVKKPKKRTDGKIRIVWIASGSHLADKPLLDPIMQEILNKYPHVELHLAGIWDKDFTESGIIHHQGTSGYKEFPQWYADLDADIAIAPLIDSQFNRCKSNIKWMEAAMLGIPTVASDVRPYSSIQHGKTGYLANSPAQFVKYLKRLIESEEQRKKIGEAAKAAVLKDWTIDKFLPKYAELFNSMNETKDISVVTAITGNKDSLRPQPIYKGVEYIAFVDEAVQNSQWKTRLACEKFIQPVMNAKIHKILTHKYVDTPYIVWIDGNLTLKTDPRKMVELLGENDFAFFKHPGRDCVYQEADACIQLKKGIPHEIAEQVKSYAGKGFPEHAGLCEMTAFVRRNTPEVNALFEAWWAEICRYSNRDQLSFPVVFQGKQWSTIPGTVAKIDGNHIFVGNDYFNYARHNHYEG